jgi:hypothetical protein
MKTFLPFFITIILSISCVIANPVLTPGVWKDITPSGLILGTGNGNTLSYDIEIDPSNPSTLYLQTTGTTLYAPIWKSTDAGSTWANIGNFNGVTKNVGFGRVRIDPKNSQHLYTISELGVAEGFWVSTDGGYNWIQPPGYVTFCGTLTQGIFNQLYDIAVDPTDFNHILLTSKQPVPVVAESKDGGTSWVAHTVPMTSGPDMNIFFLYNPAIGIGNNRTWLFASFYNGWWRTTDAGTTWTEVLPANTINQGVVHHQIYYAKNGTIYTGNQPYPVRSTDNGATWQQVKNAGLDPGYGYYFAVMGDGNYLYTGHSNIWGYMSGPTAVSRETDGMTWTPYNGGTQVLTNGPISMAFDSVNQIMYSSNLYALLALKVLGSSTGIENGVKTGSRDHINSCQTKAIISRDSRSIFFKANSLTSSKIDLYDIQGRQCSIQKVLAR